MKSFKDKDILSDTELRIIWISFILFTLFSFLPFETFFTKDTSDIISNCLIFIPWIIISIILICKEIRNKRNLTDEEKFNIKNKKHDSNF